MMKWMLRLIFVVLFVVSAKADPDVWPFGSEMPFPWRGIQGTWAFTKDQKSMYMTFKVIKSSMGFNQLDMNLYDDECRVLAKGRGFEADGNWVKGLMTNQNGAADLAVSVHVFSDATMKDMYGESWHPEGKRSNTYTVINLTSYITNKTEVFQLEKKSYSPNTICIQKKKNEGLGY